MPVLDVTINPGDTVQQAQSIKQAVNGMADAAIKFDQASGRLRDSRGRFVALAGNAKSAQTAVGGMAQGSAQAIAGMTQKTAAFGSALSGVKRSAVSSGQSVQSSIAGMTQKTNQFQSALSSLKKMMATVFTVYAIKKVAQSFLDTATEMENYRVRLRAVIKDQSEADGVFERMVNWAAEAPITTAEAIGAFVQMKAAAVANAEEATLAVANLASVMNRDMRDVAASMISGETEALRRLGVIVQRNGKEAVVQSGQFRRVVKDDMAAIRAAIIEITQLNYPNALAMRADTFSGVTETILGQLELIRMKVMGTADSNGPFAALLNMLKRVRDGFTEWMKTSEYTDFVRKVQSSAVNAINSLGELGTGLADLFKLAAANVDSVLVALKTLVAYAMSKSVLAAVGVFGTILSPVGAAAVATSLGAAYKVYTDAAEEAEEQNKQMSLNLQLLDEYKKEAVTLQTQIMAAVKSGDAALESILRSRLSMMYSLIEKFSGLTGGTVINNSGTSGNTPPTDGQDLKTKGKSAAELLVENIQAKIKYLFADGKAFLPILDAWAARLKPLSKDWQAIADLQRDIRSDAARKVADETAVAIKANEVATAYAAQVMEAKKVGTELERQQVMLDHQKGYMDDAAWGNTQGLLDNNEYLGMMVKNLADLKGQLAALGVDPNNWRNWPPQIRAAFEALQQFASKLAGTSMDALNAQFENGSISAEQYRAGLEGLKTQFAGFPMVVGDIDLKLKGFDTSIGLTIQNLAILARQAETALKDKLASVPDELSGAFAGAIAYSNDLGEALQQLARDIAFAFLKAVLLKSIFSFLGIKTAAASSPVTIPGLATSTASLSRASSSAPSTGATPATNRGNGNGDTYNITMQVQAIDTQSFQKALESQKATISSVVVQNIRSNGAVRKAIQGA